MFNFRWVLLLAFILYATFSHSQLFKRQINLYDENGQRKGLWITYWDEEKKTPMSVSRFQNGYETGVCKEYHQNGNLRLKFRYHRNRIRVKYYDKNRKLENKGWSVIEYNEVDIHYYWHGKWEYYDVNRKLIKIAYYMKGEELPLK